MDRDYISLPHLEQLVALALIEARDGKWRSTEMGAVRLIASGSRHTAVGPSAIHASPLSEWASRSRQVGPVWGACLGGRGGSGPNYPAKSLAIGRCSARGVRIAGSVV